MPNPIPLPSQEQLSSCLTYDQETGELRWKDNSIATHTQSKGYLSIWIDGTKYLAHRIIWKLMTGEDPTACVDHIDGCKTNNAWSNLRQATHSQNKLNTPCYANNILGLKGVRKERKRFTALLWVDGQNIRLGLWDTPEEAHAAYVSAVTELHGEWACT